MADLLSPYNEVIGGTTAKRDQPSPTPSAPPLEAIVTNPHTYNAQEQPSPTVTPYSSIQNDDRFSAWDDRATEILITNRLKLNKTFETAVNQKERDELWDLILTDLLVAGYSFSRIDLMQYWEFQFYIYKSNVNRFSAGIQSDSKWKYFESMDSVFKYSVEAPEFKSSKVDYALGDSSPEHNTVDKLSNLVSFRDGVENEPTITSQPGKQVLIPVKKKAVVTTQPRSTTHKYTSLAHPVFYQYQYDVCWYGMCWCCCCCDDCSDDPSRLYSGGTVGYNTSSGKTGGYTSHKHDYNTADITDALYNDGLYSSNHTTNVRVFDKNYYCLTNGEIDDDNSCAENRDDGCCDAGDGGTGTDDGGGATDTNNDVGGDGTTEDGCCGTGTGETNDEDNCYRDCGGGETDDGCCDNDGGDADHDCCDTGVGSDNGGD